MAFNVRSEWARTVARHVMSKPAGRRHGISGFWTASAPRVQGERIFRMAYIPDRRFVLEAAIDPQGTHVMTQSRFEEYVEHEWLKLSQNHRALPLDRIRRDVQTCIDRGRIVVAFRNARYYAGDIDIAGRTPFWYTVD